MTELPELAPAVPEIFLAVAAMALLMFGVFKGQSATRPTAYLALGVLAVAAVLVWNVEVPVVTFSDLFVADEFGVFMKLLVLLGTAVALLMSIDFIEREGMDRFEYPVLFLFAATGMMMMVSANDLMSLYIGLELQSLSLYVVAAFHRDSVRSAEAGLKYFVLGALSSGLFLYGASMVYGFAGTTNFSDLAALFEGGQASSLGLVVGIAFVSAALAFKVSAAPFHMWTPDVYEGAPTPVTAFFASAPKVAAMALFVRVLVGPFGELVADWQQIVVVTAMLSMVLGAFAALPQTNIKRLLAYSSIGHVGYALVGLASGTEAGIHGVMIYMAIYMLMTLGVFAVVLTMRINGRQVEAIEDFAGLSRTHPLVAACMAVLMFSMAGIPPLAGFFAKFYVFGAAIEAGLFVLAVIGVLASAVAAYYYLRIVKLMYFDDVSEPFDSPIGRDTGVVIAGTTLVMVLFIVFPSTITAAAQSAAAAFFGS
ncbi:NADH-quinone oxidoreductase subunit NuoN [Fodinicurvata sp. EGI_FJ10296]|uniref:NADH-quinone oxidoreductase subunit NuoN n=1 Tax=Fodinicurvata sp. EGI_FJ10296 TaxID=3231908 RepID=UPI0034544A83